MAPFATMILGLPAMLVEGNGVINWFHTHESIWPAVIIILSSGVLAFCLNFSIFYVIHSTTAVTFNVAGNLKVRPKFASHNLIWLVSRFEPADLLSNFNLHLNLYGIVFHLDLGWLLNFWLFHWAHTIAMGSMVLTCMHHAFVLLCTGSSCCLSFLADIPQPNLCYECCWMCHYACGMYVLWVCEAHAFPTVPTTRNSANTQDSKE
jgi:hypothetical protein